MSSEDKKHRSHLPMPTPERAGLIRPRWWLTSIDAGFEIWRGGTGLATLSYWARA